MTVDPKTADLCSISYEASYLYETFSDGNAPPKLKRCSRPVLKGGKCILHCGTTDDSVDFDRKRTFDQALLDEVKALGVPLVQAVDFSSNAGLLSDVVDAVMGALGTRAAKFDSCVFPSGTFLGGSSERIGFYDCHFGEVQFVGRRDEPWGSFEFFRCDIHDFEADEVNFTSLDLHGSHINNVVIRVAAEHVSLRGAYLAGRLEINSSTIQFLDLAYLSAEDWGKVQVSDVTHARGVWVAGIGSALNEATFFGVDWMKRDNGGLILADEEAIKSTALFSGTKEQFKSEADRAPTRAGVAQTYRNFIDVFERTRQYDLAEECFVAAMDIQSEDVDLSRMHRWAIVLYGCASRYGSSYARAAFVLVLLVGIFMGLYSLPLTNVRLAETKQTWGYTGTEALIGQLGGAALHSIEVSTFLKNPLYETYTPAGKIVEATEVVSISAQAALLLFAIRRRFKR
jgi:hypothetical protein